MRNILRSLLAVPACAAALLPQDVAAGVGEALLRGRFEAAARIAAAAASPASRARLQAALLPLAQRPAAMLAVASMHAGEPEAEAALLAGAAAALLLMDRDAAVPELAEWTAIEDRDERSDSTDVEALAPVVAAMTELAQTRAASGPASMTLREAQRLLRLATVSRFGLWPMRVPVDARIAVPPDLEQPLHLRAYRCPAGRIGWDRIDQPGALAWECELRGLTATAPPVLARGSWLLELSSPAAPWRGVRIVEASDLDVLGLVDDGVLVLAAFGPGGPTPAEWTLGRGGEHIASGRLLDAPQVIPIPGEGSPERELRMQALDGAAWMEVPSVHRAGEPATRWLAHVMVDRPLYRAGERIHGRVVLRTCGWEGNGLEAVPQTRTAVEQEIVVEVAQGSPAAAVVRGRTDAHGVFPFTVDLSQDLEPGQWLEFRVLVPAGQPDMLEVASPYLASVANFQRPAALLSVAGPDEVQQGPGTAEIVLRATWPSGGPAAGLPVRAIVSASGEREREEIHELRTGTDGRAVVRIPLRDDKDSRVETRFEATTPDGQQLEETHLLRIASATDAPMQPDPDGWGRRAIYLEAEPAVVGSECRVSLRGKARDRVLIAAGRGRRARPQTVQLDGEGHGTVAIEVLRSDWPYLDLAAATRDGQEQCRVPVALRAAEAPAIQLPARALPGSKVGCRVSTGMAGTVVTVSIVDARIFELAADRTPDPDSALRPPVPWPKWQSMHTPAAAPTAQLLDSMLLRGRIPQLDGQSWDLSRLRGFPGPGSPRTLGPAGPSLRTEFRATAAFTTAVAGEDGVAEIRFTLPDDLTTWRVTVVGIAPDGVSFLERRPLATLLPLAAEPVLPRVLRVGDAVQLPLAIDRAAEATDASDSAMVSSAVEGSSLQVGQSALRIQVPAGQVTNACIPLRAIQAGTATLALAVQLGAHGDRSQRVLQVARDAVTRPLHAAALGGGELTVPLPAGSDPACGMRVDVLQGGAAAWRRIEQDLARYPYGCVEQTLSKLLPYFAAARSARARGEPLPAMDDGYRERLHSGLTRLRELQRGDGMFSFWPGGDAEPYMTALVLHGLALLREGGLDPATVGLRCDPDAEPFRRSIRHVHQATTLSDREGVTAAELVSGGLRSVPEHPDLRAAALSLSLRQDLPPGLLARLAIALHACNEPDAARRCRANSGRAQPAPLAGDSLPGEDPLAVSALQLEHDCLVGAGPGMRVQHAADLLLACLRGQGSTYAQACALSALARALPPATPQAATISLRAGTQQRELDLAQTGEPATLRLPLAAELHLSAPDGMPLLVRVTTERSERASDHAAWSSPIQVQRELCARRRDATAAERARGEDLVVVTGALQAGRVYDLRLKIRAPVAIHYVVVDCPLPAGFEMPAAVRGVDRFDDRIAFACSLAPGETLTHTIPVLPTMAGRMVWPPAVAAPMYASGLDGGSAGGFVTVVAENAHASEPTSVTCFTAPLPPAPVEEPAPAHDFGEELRLAWELGPQDDDSSRRTVAALLAELPRLRPADTTVNWLAEFTELLQELDWSPRPSGWRLPVHERLRAEQHGAILELLAQMAPPGADLSAVETVVEALATWPGKAERERLAAQILARTRGPAPGLREELIDLIEAPAADPDLRAELLRCLEDPRDWIRWLAFTHLPQEVQQLLPPALVLACQYHDLDAGIVTMLCRSEAGRAELELRLRDPGFLRTNLEFLAAELPQALWQVVPLPGFAGIAEPIHSYDDGAALRTLATRVADSQIATSELLAELGEAPMPEWRFTLTLALRARGARVLDRDLRRNDPCWPVWCAVAALRDDDATTALDLLGALQDLPASCTREAELLRLLARPVLARAGTVPQLLSACEELTDGDWQQAFDRMQQSSRIELLARVSQALPVLANPSGPAECEALWRYGMRHDDLESVVAVLCRSAAGVACARAHLLAGAVPPRVVERFALELGLDPGTLAPRAEMPWLAVLRRAARQGLAGPWSPEESASLLSMRAMRGVGPAAVR